MCLYPIFIRNPKYLPNKKNGGRPPRMKDFRTSHVPVGCGVCKECRKQRANSWRVRMTRELEGNMHQAKFVTFTFNEESYKELARRCGKDDTGRQDNDIARLAVKLFRERWRKKYKKSIRHWFVTELGHQGTERLHLHGIIFTDQKAKEINEKWGYGFTVIDERPVTNRTINYIVKYVQKNDVDHPNYTQIVLTSPGIGNKEFEKSTQAAWAAYKGEETRDSYRLPCGRITALPHYLRNKIYSERQREELWIFKMNQPYRWVAGVKVWEWESRDIYELLRQAQADNEKLKFAKPKRKESFISKKLENEKMKKTFLQVINNIEDEEVENFFFKNFGISKK